MSRRSYPIDFSVGYEPWGIMSRCVGMRIVKGAADTLMVVLNWFRV